MSTNIKGIIATTVGVLASVFFLETYAKDRNTKPNREKAIKLISSNLNIDGFRTLNDWLMADGFVDGSYNKPSTINDNTLLTIGSGGGKTVLGKKETVDNWLRNLTASILSSVAHKAINKSPSADSQADRDAVMDWLGAEQSSVKGLSLLYKNLVSVGWASKNPIIPSGSNIPITLLLGSEPNEKRIYDYRKFLVDTDSQGLLKVVDKLVDPDDPNLVDRQLVYLTAVEASEAVPVPISGFQEFVSLLNQSGFVASPQKKTIPANIPATILLGGTQLTSAQLTTILSTATPSSISKVIQNALTDFDPTLLPRIQAMALVSQNMNNYKRETDKPRRNILLSDMYVWLKSSGFLTSNPRTYTKQDTSKFDGFVYSYGWMEIDNIDLYLKNATANDVNQLAQIGMTTGDPYQKWLAVNTGMAASIEASMYSSYPNLAGTFSGNWQIMDDQGVHLQPPKSVGEEGFTNVASGCGKSAPFPEKTQNIWDSNDPVTGLWNGKPESNDYVIRFWLNDDPSLFPIGVLRSTYKDGSNNPFFCLSALNSAIALHQKGQNVILPPS